MKEASPFLRLIAAKAEVLAGDCEKGMLWPGDLRDGLAEIYDALRRAQQLATRDR